MLMIVIDNREKSLINLCDENVNIECLDVGDIHVKNEKGSFCIIERKTLDDFSSSIIDGRYNEQKTRLKESNAYIIYIIEGLTKGKRGVNMNTILSAMYSLHKRDGFHVMRTKDVQETYDVMNIINRRFENDEKPIDDCLIIKRNKNKDTYLNMLTCINGISQKIAEDIKINYTNMSELLEHVKKSNDYKKAFINVPKIGKILSERICNTLLGN